MNRKAIIWLGSIVGALCLLVVVFAGYFLLGFFNIAAVQESHSSLVHGLMGTVADQSIKRHAGDVVPPESFGTEAANQQGIIAYDSMCVMCHGAPGKERNFVGKGMFPEPPEMDHAVEEWDTAELYWTVQNGIQMAGMPGFGITHSDEELWNIISFVETMPGMSAEEYESQLKAAKSEYGEHQHSEGESHGHEDEHSSEEHSSHATQQKDTGEHEMAEQEVEESEEHESHEDDGHEGHAH